MTEPEQPVVAVPLRAALEEDVRFKSWLASHRNGMHWGCMAIGQCNVERLAALAVEAVRPETLRETVEEFLSENSAAEANGYIDLHPLRRALVEAQR